jgi:hypothetical protein
MLQEASDVLWLLHQGLEFHAPRPPNNGLAGGIPRHLAHFSTSSAKVLLSHARVVDQLRRKLSVSRINGCNVVSLACQQHGHEPAGGCPYIDSACTAYAGSDPEMVELPMSGVQVPGTATVAGEPRTVCMFGVPAPDLGNSGDRIGQDAHTAHDLAGKDVAEFGGPLHGAAFRPLAWMPHRSPESPN